MERRCSILVLNYNGKDLLSEYLPSLVQAVEEDGGDHEIVVVDNASQDGSPEFVEESFPSVRVRRMEVNDRLFSYNVVAAEVKRDYIFILNNDVKVLSGNFFQPLLAHFDDPDVFAVMPKVVSDNPSEVYEYRCPGVFARGYLWTGRWEHLPGPGYTLFAHGAAAIFDRRKFLELGGFDRLYYPEYNQDMDISLTAWAYGWTIIFEPASIVYHRGGATVQRTYQERLMDRHKEKVSAVLILKNFHSSSLLARFLFWRAARVLRALLRGQWWFALAYWDAFKELPSVLRARAVALKLRTLSDREVFRTIRGNGGFHMP